MRSHSSDWIRRTLAGLLLTAGAIPQIAYAESGKGDGSPVFGHGELDVALAAYVDSVGRVDYAGLQRNRGPLDDYVKRLAVVGPRNYPERFPTPGHELAYWINAYNAFVLSGVIDVFPVDSVMEIDGGEFFQAKRFVTGADTLSLNQLENDIIRPVYGDPRIHFALNCGAVSCPVLANRAFYGADLDSSLNVALQRFVREPIHVRIDRGTSTIYLSKILDWFGEDFRSWLGRQSPGDDDSEHSVVDYVARFLPPEPAGYLRNHELNVVFNEYDWQLNASHRLTRDGAIPR